MSGNSLSMEQALSLVKRECSLRSIIKQDSLVVNGLERGWDRCGVENELKSIFKASEGVKDIKIITNNVSQELLGHAYVNYTTTDAAKKALIKHKYTAKIRGKQLKMMFSVRPNDLIHEDEIKMHFSVCVKNLDPAIDLQTLDNKFSKHGDILRSHVDDDTHGRDRFALIQFMDMSAAQDAVKKNQKTKFGNTIITVEAYRPKMVMDNPDQFEPPVSTQKQYVSAPPPPAAAAAAASPSSAQTEQTDGISGGDGGGGVGNIWQKRGGCRWVNGKSVGLYNCEVVHSADAENTAPVISTNGNNPSTPSLISEQEFMAAGLDSARSQLNQQSTAPSLFGSDVMQLSKNSSNSPTAVSPAPVDQIEFNTYKLFEGSQIFNSNSLFGGCTEEDEDSIDLFQLLPQSVSQELDIMQSFKCPLTGQVFRDPVMASDGVVYERNAIQNWMAKNSFQQQKVEGDKLLAVQPLRDSLCYIRQQQNFINQQQNTIEALKKRLQEIKIICSNVQF